MEKFKYNVKEYQLSGDTHTPVSLYLKLRDISLQSALLECCDYHSAQNALSIIALDPIASIKVNRGNIEIELPSGEIKHNKIDDNCDLPSAIEQFMAHFEIDGKCGIYGFTSYDAVKYIEPIDINSTQPDENDAADVHYILFRYTLTFDHFHDTITLRELTSEGEKSNSEKIISAIESRNFATYGFSLKDERYSTLSDEDYKAMVRQGIAHCQRGDVFQIVLSRRFIQAYQGDDFAVYRKLRCINPSPYLFYFDFGGMRIFGSSPETHCKIEGRKVSIDPIAGTAFRCGDLEEDARRADALLQDPKEGAEHVMLVDLARNDLSRNASGVKVDFYKQIQYYSHVIHLVSRVSGIIKEGRSTIRTFLDSLPAGTLSGSPKVRAMQLINDIEPHNRGIYGGAIGYIDFNGDINHAITIRTFVSRNSQLEYQAGAGIVVMSNPERELQETNNKLGALSKAIAEDIK